MLFLRAIFRALFFHADASFATLMRFIVIDAATPLMPFIDAVIFLFHAIAMFSPPLMLRYAAITALCFRRFFATLLIAATRTTTTHCWHQAKMSVV